MQPRICLFILGLMLSTMAAGAAHAAQNETEILQLSSPAFAPNAGIPGAYTCEGDDVPPPLSWSGVPAGTKSFAMIVDDPDAPDPSAPKKTWVHWVIYNIPATVASLAGGTAPLPAGAQEGPNDWGTPGYRGPCPPIGRHRYFFKFYALDAVFATVQTTQQALDKAALERAVVGHVLAQTTLIGTYEHTKK